MNWLMQSLVGMVLLIPAWLSISFFNKNFQVSPNVFLIWYFLGVGITSAVSGVRSLSALVPSWSIVTAMLLVGLTAGGIANVLVFRAVSGAPNPGLPVAISNGASIGVFLIAILLSRWLPGYFNPVKTDIWAFLGVVLTVIGVSLIAIRR